MFFGIGRKQDQDPTWKQPPEGVSSKTQDPEQSEIEASSNPFKPNSYYDEYYGAYRNDGEGVFVGAFAIDPRDYGVEDYKSHFLGFSVGDKGDPHWKALSADNRVIEYGNRLNDEEISSILAAISLLERASKLSDAENNTGIALSEQEKRAIDIARQRASDILTRIFEPLIDEQEQRKLAIAESDKRINERLAEERKEALRIAMGRRAGILGELMDDLGIVETDTEAGSSPE